MSDHSTDGDREIRSGVNIRDVPEDELVRMMTAELQMYEARHEMPMDVIIRPVTAIQLAGILQLALKHPHMPASHREIALTFIHHVRVYFMDAPALLEALRRGFESSGSFTCPRCGMTSHNPHDRELRYCGLCHTFID